MFLKKLNKVLLNLRVSSSSKGPYRILYKHLDFLGDIDLAAKVMSTDYFRDSIEPIELPLDKFKNFLVLAPHQDDETIGAGGLMVLLSKYGAKIDVLFTSNGAQNIKGYTKEETIELRNKEARKALSFANANFHQLQIDNIKSHPTLADVIQLSKFIEEKKPEVILLPWLLDAPSKHRLTNHLLWLSNKIKAIKNTEIWSYQVHNTLLPNTYADITSVIDIKKKMIEAYESQNSYFEAYDHLCIGMAAWNSRFVYQNTKPIQKKFAEVFFSLPAGDYMNLIEKFYFQNFEQTFKGKGEVIAGAKSVHNEVLNYIKKNV